MPRLARIEYPGACYHVLNRGRSGRQVFAEAGDRQAFLDALGAAAGKTGWQVLAFCLAPSGFQLVIETPGGNLSSGMKWLLGTFTGGHRRRHGTRGPLFRGRYRALLVQPDSGPWLARVVDYVHLTPAREHLIGAGTPLRAYPVSSVPAILSPIEQRPDWLDADRTLRVAGFPPNDREAAISYAAHLETLRRMPPEREWRRIRRGWCFGDAAFKTTMTALLRGGSTSLPHGSGAREPRAARAEQIITAELAALGWDEATLGRRPKMSEEKAHIASRLRRETVVTLEWIARRLHMGSVNTVRNLLMARRRRAAEAAAAPEPWLEEFDVRWD